MGPQPLSFPGTAQPRSNSSHVTLSHQREQTAPCLASWLPTLASRPRVRASVSHAGPGHGGDGLRGRRAPCTGVQPERKLGGNWGSVWARPVGCTLGRGPREPAGGDPQPQSSWLLVNQTLLGYPHLPGPWVGHGPVTEQGGEWGYCCTPQYQGILEQVGRPVVPRGVLAWQSPVPTGMDEGAPGQGFPHAELEGGGSQ